MLQGANCQPVLASRRDTLPTQIVGIIHACIHALSCTRFETLPELRRRQRLPALGECVWHASPAMNTRSCAENCVATRCPTAHPSQDDSGGTKNQEKEGARTDVERPPIDLP